MQIALSRHFPSSVKLLGVVSCMVMPPVCTLPRQFRTLPFFRIFNENLRYHRLFSIGYQHIGVSIHVESRSIAVYSYPRTLQK
jgi:hypothetical protein